MLVLVAFAAGVAVGAVAHKWLAAKLAEIEQSVHDLED